MLQLLRLPEGIIMTDVTGRVMLKVTQGPEKGKWLEVAELVKSLVGCRGLISIKYDSEPALVSVPAGCEEVC